MYKITNIGLLGTDYTITDSKGKIIQTVQVVSTTDILDAALGEFDESFSSIDEYLEQSLQCLSGFMKNSLYKTLWWSTPEQEFDLVEVIEYAVQNGYTKIILEHMPKE